MYKLMNFKGGIFLILLCFCGLSESSAQLNVQLLHQLVEESKSEHSRQQDAKNRQAVVSANEEYNKTQLSKLKTRYRELQNRFKAIALAIDAAQIGLQAAPVVEEIIQQQSNIFTLAWHQPLLLPLAYDSEADMVMRARKLCNYLYGLFLSIGDLNQMKASDRRMLFSYVLTELRRIAGAARGLASTMYYASRRSSLENLSPFRDFINQDQRMVDDIIRNTNSLFKP
ncbi:hypothetical protein HDC92_004346 [Pedobacter sp. AK017]|uniref:hypothetical protein n=1 Tax=Pedobacter sp. AK017 TaxID=2723073 RepID=UPI001618F456|nr:hypothetical protein [Pedobacter sp. AK017]MBB5440643.1 hypothetical protein [Pedobacter sp. AK017]